MLLVRHLGDWRSAALPWKVGGARVQIADTAFTVADGKYEAGTAILDGVFEFSGSTGVEQAVTTAAARRKNPAQFAASEGGRALL